MFVASPGMRNQRPVYVEVEGNIGKKTTDECVEKREGWLDGRTEDEQVPDRAPLSAPSTFRVDVGVHVVKHWQRRENIVEQFELYIALLL